VFQLITVPTTVDHEEGNDEDRRNPSGLGLFRWRFTVLHALMIAYRVDRSVPTACDTYGAVPRNGGGWEHRQLWGSGAEYRHFIVLRG